MECNKPSFFCREIDLKHQQLASIYWFFVLLLVVGLACNLPTGPSVSGDALVVSGSGSAVVSSSAAGIVIADNGAQLEIPNGAVPPALDGSPGTADFSIAVDPSMVMELPAEFTPNSSVYRLMPDGVAFGMPVKLTLPIPESVDVRYVLGVATYDDASGTWQLLPALVDEQARTVVVEVGHFSYYGLFGLASFLEDRESWAERNGGWFNIVNTARDGAALAPFGKPLPANVYYGVCVQAVSYKNAGVQSWNWQRSTDWMIGVSAQKNQDATHKQWLPAGTYTLMEFYAIGETQNDDYNYTPQHRYYVRPMGEADLWFGEQVDFYSPGALNTLEAQGFTRSEQPCWTKPMDTPPVEQGVNWGSLEVVNTHRNMTTTTHFGKRLPARVYYGVCSLNEDYDDPMAETWNWHPPLNWMMGVTALGEREASRIYQLPVGTYSLLEVYLLAEQKNADIDYAVQGRYYYRPLKTVRIVDGLTINYTSPAPDPGAGDWGQSLKSAGFLDDLTNPCNRISSISPLPTMFPTKTAVFTIVPTLISTPIPPPSGCSFFTIPPNDVWNASWFDSGINLYAGQTAVFTASGTVRPSTFYDVYTGPEGTSDFQGWQDNYTFRSDWPAEAVIARIGGGDLLHIGTGQSISILAGGRLELGVNDSDPGNNEGSFEVKVCW
jgi:hypothetical protein